MNLSIKELPSYEVAYLRHVGSHLETSVTWGKLLQWAVQHELFPPKQNFIGISLDNPEHVEPSAFRYDACVTLPAGFEKVNQTDVQFQTLPGGMYALYSFYDSIDQLAVAYQSIFEKWLPNSDYAADDRPCLEFSMNNPAEDPEGKAKVDLYVAIKKK